MTLRPPAQYSFHLQPKRSRQEESTLLGCVEISKCSLSDLVRFCDATCWWRFLPQCGKSALLLPRAFMQPWRAAFPETPREAAALQSKERGGIYRSREKERWRQMLLKSHVISGRAATPISSPYYSNLSEGEKSNIPRPGTFNTSSQDPGRQAGRQAAGRGIKHQDFQRGRAEEGCWLCSTPAANRRRRWRRDGY